MNSIICNKNIEYRGFPIDKTFELSCLPFFELESIDSKLFISDLTESELFKSNSIDSESIESVLFKSNLVNSDLIDSKPFVLNLNESKLFKSNLINSDPIDSKQFKLDPYVSNLSITNYRKSLPSTGPMISNNVRSKIKYEIFGYSRQFTYAPWEIPLFYQIPGSNYARRLS